MLKPFPMTNLTNFPGKTAHSTILWREGHICTASLSVGLLSEHPDKVLDLITSRLCAGKQTAMISDQPD